MVNNDTFLSDSILFVRDDLRANITDPISTSRPTGEKFVMTSYPRRETSYPIITITSLNITSKRVGQQSEKMFVTLSIEVRIWARTQKEKYNLFDSVDKQMRENQYGVGSSTKGELHDFKMNSAVDIDDPGEDGLRSKVIEYEYYFITT